MTAIDTHPVEDEWLAWRMAGITASDIAAAASGRYGGAHNVVARKLGLIPPQEQTAQMARGLALETRIATAAELLLGVSIVGEQSWAQHPDRPHWRATLDGMAVPAELPSPGMDDVIGVVETKTRGRDVKPAWDYWAPQCQWQMLVIGVPLAILVECVVTDADDGTLIHDLRLHRVEADEFVQTTLIELAEDLWRHVQAGTLPEPTSAAELDSVKAVTLTVDPSADVVDLSDIAADVARAAEIRQAIKAVEDERDLLEARLRARIGDATKGTADGWTVSVAKPMRIFTEQAAAELLAERPDLAMTVLDKARAKTEAKELYEQLRQPIGARRLTIKESTR